MKKHIFTWLSLCVIALGVTALPAHAADLTVDEIVDKANLVSYYAGDSGQSDVTMTITDSQDRTRVRKFRILRLDVEEGGEQKFYVYFREPSDVAQMVFMVWKHPGEDDDRWLYLPALDLVRRISASDKRSSFVGSHFLYEDVSGRGTEADTHELAETTDKYYIVNNLPKDPDNVEFASYKVWIDRSNFMPMKIEYYNGQGEKMRSIESIEVKEIQGNPTVTKSVATDFVRGGKTVNEFNNIEYNVGLTENIFQERYLRRPPVKWIR
jgi:outer membrane lipoprotein-sorting protein